LEDPRRGGREEDDVTGRRRRGMTSRGDVTKRRGLRHKGKGGSR